MMSGLLIFLIGALILVVVVYVAKLILDMLTLPPQIRQIALLIIGLVGLIILLILVFQAFSGNAVVIRL